MENLHIKKFNKRISWGSIIGGIITVLAISILLSVLGSSIGLYMFDPLANNPVSGIGTTVGIWTVISFLLSLAAGGFVAGKLAGSDGLIHGFLVWASTLIIALMFGTILAMGVAKATANVLGAVSSVTGSVVSGVGNVVQEGGSQLSDQASDLFGNIDINTDINENNIEDNVRNALRKSGVKEFQPEYLNNQLNEIKSDLEKSVKKLVTNPTDADTIIDGFTNRLKDRAESFNQKIDRNDLTKAIANNSTMSQAEIEKTVDQYIKVRDNAIDQGKIQLQNLEASIEKAKQQWAQTKHEVLQQVNAAAHTAATACLLSFFALLIGAGVCAFTGKLGAKKTGDGYEI